MDDLTIRPAGIADAAGLALAGGATFLETYAHRINGADIVAHAARKHSEVYYAACLADPDTRVWVAETASQAIIGYLMLAPATLPEPMPHPQDLEVVRIYVLSRFQKTGVGHRLMLEAFAEGVRQRARQIVLGVYKGNEKALAFYKRQGFTEIGTRTFSVGAAQFHDLVLARTSGISS